MEALIEMLAGKTIGGVGDNIPRPSDTTQDCMNMIYLRSEYELCGGDEYSRIEVSEMTVIMTGGSLSTVVLITGFVL